MRTHTYTHALTKPNAQRPPRVFRYGARLHELLGSHADTKEAAARALGKNFDVDTLQKHLHRMVESVAEQTEQMDTMLGNVEQDQTNLQSKIDKKKGELDRHQKRLQSLQVLHSSRQCLRRSPLPHTTTEEAGVWRLHASTLDQWLHLRDTCPNRPPPLPLPQTVRPAFMDEYERLESELAGQYALYVQSWCAATFRRRTRRLACCRQIDQGSLGSELQRWLGAQRARFLWRVFRAACMPLRGI